MFHQYLNFSLSFLYDCCMDSNNIHLLHLVYMSPKFHLIQSFPFRLFFFVIVTYLLRKSHCLCTRISQALGFLMPSSQCHLTCSSVFWKPVVISRGLTRHRFDFLERIHHTWYHELPSGGI